jgi:hypothetical protein
LVGVLSAIAIGKAMEELARGFSEGSPSTVIAAALLTAVGFRFYHGNWRYLDDRYVNNATASKQWFFSMEVIFTLLQGSLIAAMAFTLGSIVQFAALFAGTAVLDVPLVLAGRWEPKSQEINRAWAVNNGIFASLIAVVLIVPGMMRGQMADWALLVMIAVNTTISYVINWNSFFPPWQPLP